MKNKKSLLIVLCAALLVCATIVGTLAYLTDRDTVTNTFTVGDVQIRLDEAKVDENGKAVDPEERVTENTYHLIPGKTYDKDPTMTVEKGSEESYVRMKVEINKMGELDKIFAAHNLNLTTIFVGYDEKNWELTDMTRDAEANTVTYEFRYPTTVMSNDKDVTLDALFDQIEIPGEITKEELATLYTEDTTDVDLYIKVTGEAIQAETFKNADEAWAAFDVQYAASK